MKKQNGFTLVELILVPLILAGVAGWIWNIIKLVGTDFALATGMFIIRCIGIFVAPLGAILGYL